MPNRTYERIKQISDTLPLCEEWLAPETLILRKYADTQVFSRKNFYAHFPGWHLWHFYGCFRMSDCVFQRTLSGEYIQEMLSANCILLRQFKSNWCLWHNPSSPKLVKRGDDGHDEDGCFEGGKLKALASWWGKGGHRCWELLCLSVVIMSFCHYVITPHVHNVRNMFKYTSKMTSVMVNMINIDHHS